MTEMTQTERAYTIKCPKCQQPAGHHCVYVMNTDIKGLNPNSPWLSRTQYDKIARVGTPTQRPHIERFHAEWNRSGQRARRAMYENAHPVHTTSDQVRAAHKAMTLWDLTEYRQLCRWFRRHGHILSGS